MYEAPCWDLRIRDITTRTGRQFTPYGAVVLTRAGVSQTITEDKGTPHAAASTTHVLEKSLLNQSHSGKRNECRRAVLDSRSCMESEGREA